MPLPEDIAIGVVKLPAMAVALVNVAGAVRCRRRCRGRGGTGKSRVALSRHVGEIVLIGHGLMTGLTRATVTFGVVDGSSRRIVRPEFDAHHLHAQTQPQIRDFVLTRPACRCHDFTYPR